VTTTTVESSLAAGAAAGAVCAMAGPAKAIMAIDEAPQRTALRSRPFAFLPVTLKFIC